MALRLNRWAASRCRTQRSSASIALWFILLVVASPWRTAGAEPLGTIQAYQKAFAAAASQLGVEHVPAGPVWLEPQVLPGTKEACTSCHLGIADNRFLYARLPYRRHRGHYLQDHPPETFGCTICHGGVAAGQTFAAAGHAPPADPARRQQWTAYYGWQPPDAHGMVPLKWITGRCAVCHPGSDLPRGAEPYQQARQVVADKQCTACHRFGDEPTWPVRVAVHLGGLGSKLSAPWLVGYLQDPHGFRPGTAMPGYDYKKNDAERLAAYLLSHKDPSIKWNRQTGTADSAAVQRGRQVVAERRCRICHDIPGIKDDGFLKQHKIGPSLARVGEKLNPQWIRRWLADPSAVRPEAGMPRFRLSDSEIDDITAFLTSLRRPDAPPAAAAPLARVDTADAVRLAAAFRCAGCHSSSLLPRSDLTAVGPEVVARAAAKREGSLPLEGPEGLFHRRPATPRLFGPDQPADPVLTFLAGQVDLPVPASFRLPRPKPLPEFHPAGAAGKLVERFRCLSCHTIRGTGGDIGPELTYAGSKLRRDWLVRFLQSPEPIRPMNRARMPKLGLTAEEAQTLADWITTELKAAEVDANQPDLDFAFAFVGAAKVKSPYGCITCHRIGEEGGRVGPELTHVGSRLQPGWIYHWIKNPRRWKADVRMPVFQMDDEDRLAITRYLSEQK